MSNAHFQRGLLLFQQGRSRDAVGELQLALGQNADDPTTHGILALCLEDLEQYAEATEHAQRAIHLAPDEGFGHYTLARVMFGRHRYAEAQAAIDEAIRLDPYNPGYFGLLAELHLGQHRWREALEAANQGLEIDPEHQLCTNLRVQALIKLGDRAAAAETMGEALARRPDDALTHANQGWALLHQGNPQQAAVHFREALRLQPDFEWARAGIVEALKARNFVYRWLLAYFLWMSRLTPNVRWGLILGAYFAQRIVRTMANNSPQLAPVLWPLLFLYMGFVLLSWLAPSLFNLLLRFDRFGRHALSPDQVRGANVLVACLVPPVVSLVAWLITGWMILFWSTLLFLPLALPASAVYVCHEGWPRRTMAAVTLGLAAAIVFVLAVGALEAQVPDAIKESALALLGLLPWALIGSQFLAMALVNVTPTK